MKTYLKIKIKSLAAEARIIRAEERKWPKPHPLRLGLRYHRVLDVRREARVALLAYGFLRGRSYLNIEPIGSKPANWQRVATLIRKYGHTPFTEAEILKVLKDWVELGVKYNKAA